MTKRETIDTTRRLIDDLTERLGFKSDELPKLLKAMKCRQDATETMRFLVILRTNDPGKVLDAYYRFQGVIEKNGTEQNSTRNIRIFSGYLFHSNFKTVSISNEINDMAGMYDGIDDESTKMGLDTCIGILENEDY